MSQFMYRVLAWITALVVSGGVVRTEAPVGPEISAPSAVLMEASTGQIIYEIHLQWLYRMNMIRR